MWCHLCTQDYRNFEEFRLHILEKHRSATTLCKNSDNGSENSVNNLEIKDENDAVNTSGPKCFESDHVIPIENSPVNHNDVGEVSVNTTLKKRKRRHNKENKSDTSAIASNTLSKKSKMSSILKKRVKKPTLKVSFNKKRLAKRKMIPVSYQEDTPGNSDSNESEHSENSLNVNNEENSQSELSNFINPSGVINSQSDPQASFLNSQSNQQSTVNKPQSANTYSQPMSNNPVYIVNNPYGSQNMNNYVLGNQPVQPPVYIVNTVATKPTSSNNSKCFEFNSRNILKWLGRHQELCKSIEYPLPSSLYNRIKMVHKGIFDHYFTASIKEESAAVMKVYEDIDCMILKHINSVHNLLSV